MIFLLNLIPTNPIIAYFLVMEHVFSNNTFLIGQLKGGDENAYVYLVDTFYDQLCAYAHSLVRDQDQAEDIVQNVLIRTWERRDTLKTHFKIKSFLFRSVHNEFIDHYRKQKSVSVLEKNYAEQLQHSEPLDDAILERLLAFMHREIQNLPPKCRRIFLMSKREGCSNKEIADHLKVSKKTIEYHMTKAFAILRRKADSHLGRSPS